MRLSPHCEALLQKFIDLRPQLIQLDNKVFELLQTTMQQQGIELNSIEHRIKGVESLAGKLERKGEKYHSLRSLCNGWCNRHPNGQKSGKHSPAR